MGYTYPTPGMTTGGYQLLLAFIYLTRFQPVQEFRT